jgi:hypothetical protein
MSLAARPGTAVEPLCSIASTASPSCRANAAASCSNWPGQGRVVVHDGDGGHARSVGTRGWLLSQTAVEAEISAFPVGESPMAVRHPASNPSRTNQAGLSMTPQEVTKEKAERWTRRRAFVQVRNGPNIQLLPFPLVC